LSKTCSILDEVEVVNLTYLEDICAYSSRMFFGWNESDDDAYYDPELQEQLFHDRVRDYIVSAVPFNGCFFPR
jgi:hypothetical protein